MGTFRHYGIGRRCYDNDNHWQELNIVDTHSENYYQITKPTIICFGGNHTAKPKDANYYCRIVESLIGLGFRTEENQVATFDDVDIIGVYYGLNLEKKMKKDGTPAPLCDFSDKEINEIIENLLLPLFKDGQNRRLPLELAKRNFAQVTFLTHCYGAVQLFDIMEELKTRLEKLGYSSKEISSIMSDSRQVSFAPWTDARNVPTVSFKSLNDTTAHFDVKYRLEHRENLDGIKVFYNEVGSQGRFIYPKAEMPSVEVFSSKMINELKEDENEHSLSIIERFDDDWTLCDNSDSKNADAISQMMACAIAENVARAINMLYDEKYIPSRNLKDVARDLQDVTLNFKESDLTKNSDMEM